MSEPRRALIVVDAQREYFEGALPIVHPPRESALARIVEAVGHARAADIPVVVVRHESPGGTIAFVPGSRGAQTHRDVEAVTEGAIPVVKRFSSVFAGTGLAERLNDDGVDTVTLVGFMTNNCILASAADAEPRGLSVEVLSDATGAVGLANDAGSVGARTVHETLMPMLHSNWAAVADVRAWAAAVAAGRSLAPDSLVASAARHRTGTPAA